MIGVQCVDLSPNNHAAVHQIFGLHSTKKENPDHLKKSHILAYQYDIQLHCQSGQPTSWLVKKSTEDLGTNNMKDFQLC